MGQRNKHEKGGQKEPQKKTKKLMARAVTVGERKLVGRGGKNALNIISCMCMRDVRTTKGSWELGRSEQTSGSAALKFAEGRAQA